MGAAGAGALGEPCPEARGEPPARAPLLTALEWVPTLLAAVATLAPAQGGPAAAKRQISHRHHGPLVDLQVRSRAVGASLRSRDQLDLEVELVAPFDDVRDPEAIQADEAANVILHPLFLLDSAF